MKPFEQTILILWLAILTAIPGICQEKNYATDIKTEISDDKVLITYDAVATDGTQFFDIILLITYNGEKIQPNSLYGDYGEKISAGTEKAIVWYYKDDFNDDINNLRVEVFAYRHNEALQNESIAEEKGLPSVRFIGIRGGLNLANLRKKADEIYNENFKICPGFQLGATVEFPVSETVSFETGFLFSVNPHCRGLG